MKTTKILPLIAGPLAFVLLQCVDIQGLSEQGQAVAACATWIAIWWIFEVTHLAVTALLPIIIFPLSGALDLPATTAAYGHKFIFLFLGGFILGVAIEKWGLHKRIALSIILVTGTNIPRMILGFMLATAFLSMWISNTATATMMLPIGMAIVSQLSDHPDTPENENIIFGRALMLAIAYSASVGGLATLIGTPPNLVLAGVIQELYDIEISFLQWFSFGLPISLILLAISWIYLTKVAFTFKIQDFPGGRQEIQRLWQNLGKMSYEEKIILAVFVTTAILWMSRSLLQQILPALDDTIIAILASVSLFLLPASTSEKKLLSWSEAVRIPWGIILLFGSGMALAVAFQDSGLTTWIGNQLRLLESMPIFILLLLLICVVNFMTEITSNLATTAMLLPILAPLALTLEVHPYLLLVSAATAASCAFMLPVATPPNAIVFGSGYLNISTMVRVGIAMNIISIILLSLMVYYLLHLIWGFIPDQYPAALMR